MVETLSVTPVELEQFHMSRTALCPECDGRIHLGSRLKEGQVVTCARCSTELEILSLDPLELDWAFSGEVDDWNRFDLDEQVETPWRKRLAAASKR